MTAAKIMDVIAKLPDCEVLQLMQYQHTLKLKWTMLPDCSKFQSQNVQKNGYG